MTFYNPSSSSNSKKSCPVQEFYYNLSSEYPDPLVNALHEIQIEARQAAEAKARAEAEARAEAKARAETRASFIAIEHLRVAIEAENQYREGLHETLQNTQDNWDLAAADALAPDSNDSIADELNNNPFRSIR